MVNEPRSPLETAGESLRQRHNRLKAKFQETLKLPASSARTDAILALSEELRLLAKALRQQAEREREVARFYSAINADFASARRSNDSSQI